MFPPVQAISDGDYKAILSEYRKQSQEMEMHRNVLSATSSYLFGQIFCLVSWEFPSVQIGWLRVGRTCLKCHVGAG